jgi:hypothetical protein
MPSTGVARRFRGRMFMPASTDPRTQKRFGTYCPLRTEGRAALCVPSQRFMAADVGESFTGVLWERKQIR